MRNPNVGYGYHQAVKACGWKPLGSPNLAPVKISTYESDDGYARVSVDGNPNLTLNKGFNKYGGGCHIGVYIQSLFGMKNSRWTSEKVDLTVKRRLSSETRRAVRSSRGDCPTAIVSTFRGATCSLKVRRQFARAWKVGPMERLKLTRRTASARSQGCTGSPGTVVMGR